MLTGYEPGRGAFYGQLTVTRGADRRRVRHAGRRIDTPTAAPVVQRNGRSIVYTGYQWRGRSTDPAARARDTIGLREVMFVEPGWEEMSGRWFTGGYEEIGMDVSLKKLGANPVIAGVAPRALRVGTRGQDGDHLRREPAATRWRRRRSTSGRASRSSASCARRRTRSRCA